jgi:succinoglycan biosynthesis protein ExoA
MHGSMPMVSVIMPVRDEESCIGMSLNAILDQSYPHDLMEVIVADGMSTDGTREIIDQLASATEIPIYIVDNPKRIAPTGLNRAIEKSSGEIIIRVDGHCEIDRDYVENCVELLRSGRADGVGGPIETIGDGARASVIALAMSSPFGVGGSAFRTIDDREMYTDTVAFPGYTREILSRAGPFDEQLVRNQDDEYNYRIRELGGRILLSPTIRSRYFSRSTLRSLWRQYYQYGYWKVRVLQLHPRQMRARQFVPFVFVTVLLLLLALSWFSTVGRYMLAACVAAYLVVNIAAAFRTSRRIAKIPILSVSFAILHLSYGLGSWAGLIAFRKQWSRPNDPRLDEGTRANSAV